MFSGFQGPPTGWNWNMQWNSQGWGMQHPTEETKVSVTSSCLNKWVSDCCLSPTQQFSAISWQEPVIFQWDDDKVRFVLDQHA